MILLIQSLSDARKLLGVSSGASQKVIRKKYLEMAKQFHPDAGGDPDMFKELHEAYEVLYFGKIPESKKERFEFRKQVAKDIAAQRFRNLQGFKGQTRGGRFLYEGYDREKHAFKNHKQIVHEYGTERNRFLSDVKNARLRVHLLVARGRKFLKEHRRGVILTTALLGAILAGRYLWNAKKRAFQKRYKFGGLLTHQK